MLLGAAPFVLLDDARVTGAAPARLYEQPQSIIEATVLEDVAAALDAVAEAKGSGLHTAGFLSYEAGAALDPGLAGTARDPGLPLLWFGLFREYRTIAPSDVAALLPEAAGGWVGRPLPAIARAGYSQTLATLHDYIAAGDIYQANLTFGCDVPVEGHPLAIYAGLRKRACAGYGGVVWTGSDWLLSLSPELFFAMHDGRITTRPMKGTAARDADDAKAIASLRNDAKQRAENLMIVDLLRNDLSRIAEPGSVATPELFRVETYPTVHQMTSTVTAKIRQGLGAVDVLRALFPCGSITGAPKIRAMEIIREVEPGPRGAYTGAIGRIDAGGDAAFNVAIRTLHVHDGRARLGLGSGIVSDSRAQEEWEECLAKGKFVEDMRRIDLIETMRFDPTGGIHLLDRHIARIGKSAAAFNIPFDRHAVRNELQAATFRIAGSRRVRLMLSQSGTIAIEIGMLHATPEGPVAVAVAPLRAARSDFRLAHKTSDRSIYANKRAGAFETLFTDCDGFLTEGSFTNIFVRGNGALKTPPLSRGLLPGVLREELLANGSAIEADLKPADLRDGFFIGNASRGLLPAMLQPL